VTGSTAVTGRRPGQPSDGARLAALEEQRDFLLASLDDLEREHAAGDVDAHDYEVLKDDYTARAAAVIRAIELRQIRAAPAPAARRWPRTLAWAAVVVVFAVVAGVLVAQSAGRRDTGGFATGDIRQSVASRLNEALVLTSEGEFDEAIARYDAVLSDQPSNAEALTYRAWALRLSGEREEGLTALLDAATVARDYPDVHAFLAVVFFQEGLYELALQEVEIIDSLDPPAHIREQIDPFRERIAAALSDRRPGGQDPQAGGGT
jgi:tetratricopeptide (TPR) repeat protein